MKFESTGYRQHYISEGSREQYLDQRGEVFYVSSSGSDTTGDGKSWSSAVKTINKAVELCTSGRGDLIYVAPGFYMVDETQTIDKSDIKIYGCSNGDESVQFFGSGSTSSATASDYNLITITGGNIELKNLGLFTYKNTKSAIYINGEGGGYNGGGCVIDGCLFSPQVADGQAYGIMSEAGAMNTVKNCKFYATKTAGIYIKGSTSNNPTRWVIKDNLFYGCGDAGIKLDSAVYEMTIKDNVFQTGSQTGYNMADDIVLTSSVNAGDVNILGNYSSTTTFGDFVADSSTGTMTTTVLNNFYTADS